MPDGCTDVAVVLRTLVRDVAELQRKVADLEARARRLAPADVTAASALLPVVVQIIGNATFTVADLLTFAATPSAGADMLYSAIATASGRIDRTTGKRIGKLLRRLNGAVVDGLTVERHGIEAPGAVWSVKAAQGVSVGVKTIPVIVRAQAAA